MGDVIQMFRSVEVSRQDEGAPFEPYVVLTQAMQDEIVEVSSDMEDLWLSTSEEEFVNLMLSIKQRVSAWPTGKPDG